MTWFVFSSYPEKFHISSAIFLMSELKNVDDMHGIGQYID